jgi:hypothetical protein
LKPPMPPRPPPRQPRSPKRFAAPKVGPAISFADARDGFDPRSPGYGDRSPSSRGHARHPGLSRCRHESRRARPEMHRGQKPSLPSPATLEISRKDRIRRQGQMPQGAELLCLVGPGHGHPASPPSVPLQVMQQIASGFKSAEVTSATLSAADAALARRHRFPAPPRSRLPAWLGIGSAIVLGLREEGCFELRCRPERAVAKVRALCRSKRDSKSRSRRVRAAERARSQSPSRERTRA